MSGIQMALLGGQGTVVRITDVLVEDVQISPDDARAAYTLANTGQVILGVATFYENWIDPQFGMSDYEARATLTAGALTNGTTGSWLNLGTTRQWDVERSSLGTNSATLTMEIRPVGGSVVTSATITLTATVDI
jgi:hypothetical protein